MRGGFSFWAFFTPPLASSRPERSGEPGPRRLRGDRLRGGDGTNDPPLAVASWAPDLSASPPFRGDAGFWRSCAEVSHFGPFSPHPWRHPGRSVAESRDPGGCGATVFAAATGRTIRRWPWPPGPRICRLRRHSGVTQVFGGHARRFLILGLFHPTPGVIPAGAQRRAGTQAVAGRPSSRRRRDERSAA